MFRKLVGISVALIVAVTILFSLPRDTFGQGLKMTERFVVIFDLSGTFLHDRANIVQSLGKIDQFGRELKTIKDEEAEEIKNDIREQQLYRSHAFERSTKFTLIGLASNPKVIWSGNIENFLEANENGQIRRLIEEAVDDSMRNGESRCTDIRGALELGFRRIKADDSKREMVVRSGFIVFSDLLNDPPHSTGGCRNVGDPSPPEGEFWNDLSGFLDENEDRINTPPEFIPSFSFIALGIQENPVRSNDPKTLWTEKLRSYERENNPFLLEFRSFRDAVNYAIPLPTRLTRQDIESYLDNFDFVMGIRFERQQKQVQGGSSNWFSVGMILLAVVALFVFFLIVLIVAGILIFVLVRRRNQQRVIPNEGR